MCEGHLPDLRSGGPLASLISRQAELHHSDNGIEQMVAANNGLPRDLLNFQYDSVAIGAALEWDCIEVSERRLALVVEDGWLRLDEWNDAPIRRIVIAIDPAGFSARWLETVKRL